MIILNKQLVFQLRRVLLIIIFVLAILIIIKYSLRYVYPLLIAYLFAYLLEPIVTFLVRKCHFPRPIAILTVMIFLIFSFLLFAYLIITEMIIGIIYLSENVPDYYKEMISIVEEILFTYIYPLYENILFLLNQVSDSNDFFIKDSLKSINQEIANLGANVIKDTFIMIANWLIAIPNSFFSIIIILLLIYFILKDWSLIHLLKDRAFAKYEKHLRKMLHQLKMTTIQLLKTQFVLMLITMGITLSFLLIFQIKYSLAITALVGTAELLPLVGAGIIFLPWILYAFFSQMYSLTIGLAITYLLIIIMRQIIEPKLLASYIGIHPIIVILIMYLNFQFWGLTGLIFTPIWIILITILKKANVFYALWDFIRKGRS